MERAAVSLSAPPSVVFHDGLGERRQTVDPTGHDTLELLCLRDALSSVPSFEFALRERVGRLAGFRHAYYARVRSVDRLNERDQPLALVSDHVPGIRLSELLTNLDTRGVSLDINTALCLIRQLVPAIATLHEHARDVAHGALGPERLVVTPNARLIVVEHVMGAALEQLRFSQERYWTELRIPLPRSAGQPRFDHRADVTQLGCVALSLILGRMLRDEEYPSRVGDMLASTWAVSARGGFEPLPPGLRAWLGRALQLDPRNAFPTAVDAQAEFDKVLGDSDYLASPASLEAFLAKYHAAAPRRFLVEPPGAARASGCCSRGASTTAGLGLRVAWAGAPSPSSGVTAPSPRVRRLQPIAESVTVKPLALKTVAPVNVAGPVNVDPVNMVEPPVNKLPEVWPERAFNDADRSPTWRRPKVMGAVAALLLIPLTGAGLAARRYFATPPVVGHTGTLVITSNPSGAETVVDGELRGATPLTLTLAAGSHVVELRNGGAPRSIPVTIAAGAQATQYIELPKIAPTSGQLQVRTDPPGAEVVVDGVSHGRAPTLVGELTPGEHLVVMTSELGSVKQTVTVEPGSTASLVVPMAAPEGAPVSGWIAVSASIDLQIFEHDRLIGTSQSDRLMVAAGRHDLDLVNDALGYRATRTVQVAAGKVSPIKVDMPKGTIALNATPWADVWIDGEHVGETPIGNLALSIGTHDIVFRHPDLGELHHTALVTLKEAARLSVDLRKK